MKNDMAFGLNSYSLAGRVSPARKRWVYRVRFQWPMVLLVAVGLPLVFRAGWDVEVYLRNGTINSVIIAAIAVTIAYFSWRRLHRFPGVQLGASALWSVAMVFGAALVFVLISRVEYNRFIMFLVPLLTLGYFWVVSWLAMRSSGVRIGVVPGGKVDLLPVTPHVNWIRLSAAENTPRLDAFLADLRHDHAPSWETFIADQTLNGVPVYHYKQVTEHLTGQVSIDHLSENSFGSVLPNASYVSLKRGVDLLVLLVLAPLIVPLFAIVWTLVKVVDGGPALFSQERGGMGGRPFVVRKFRTMRRVSVSPADAFEAAKTRLGDERITPLGAWLRKTRLDEIAQVINIARGEMSWIGPRPEAMVLAKHYEASFPFYRYRYAVRPGVTGWAQVNQGHVVDDDDLRLKLRYDFYYVKNISPWLDLLIAMKTCRIVLFGIGAK